MSEHTPETDRAVSAVATRRKPLSKATTVAIGVAATGVVLGFVFWMNPGHHEEPAPKSTQARIAQTVSYPPPVREAALTAGLPAPSIERLPAPNPPSIANTLGVTAATGEKPQGSRMYSYAAAAAPAAAPAGQQSEAGPVRTTVAFKGADLPGVRAGRALNQTYTLMPGVHHCVLDSAVQSDLPGPIMCHLRDDALSPTGVVLMERGTRVIGEYKNNIQQGQSRIFTVAATAYTPNGVPVPLDSPMADGLGRAGLDGEVNNHLLARFGGGVLLSLVDNAFSLAGSALQSGNGNTNLNFNSGGLSGVATEVLRNTINIPPTITKNQGEDVTIFIRYPIDFSDAYRLVPRR